MSVSMNNIVNVTVEVSAVSTITSNFNLGLIMGSSQALASQKVKVYTKENYATQMVTDGFETTDAEYIKAGIYFSQNPSSSQVAIGCIASADTSNPENSLTAIRALNANFYGVCFADGVSDTTIANVAAAVEAFSIPTVLFYVSQDAQCIAASSSNILKTLQQAAYTRTFAFYSQDENLDAAVLGLFSGYNTMEVNSAYTLSYKSLVGVTADNLSDEQLANVVGYNGNAYCIFGNTYSLTYPAISSGDYNADIIYLIDVAKYLIQQYAITGLISQRKIAYTEDGVSTILSFIGNACQQILNVGLIAGGIWNGEPVKNLNTGDAIENGYYIDADTVASQTSQARSSRTSPPIYVALLASGAIEHIVIKVFVNQ